MIGPKILIVDDDPDLLLGLKLRLKASGYQVVTAMDVKSAISVAMEETPHIIILDIGLPDGDGFDVMQRLKEVMTIRIPVVILSGRDPKTNIEQACIGGAEAYFLKPADNDELIDEIDRTLKHSYQLNTQLV